MGSENRVSLRQPLRAWKPYSEAERIELYRRTWGPSWSPGGIGTLARGRHRRDQLIQRHLIVVEAIAGTLLRAGQNPAIQKHDLLQVGYAELIRTIDRPAVGTLTLEKRIARNCKTAMIRFVEGEQREWRYVQQGRGKAIRDTRAGLGLPASEKAIRAAENVTQEAADEFIYPDWLRGSVSVCRRLRADLVDDIQGCDLPEELAEIAHGIGYQFKQIPECALRFYVRPKLECFRQPFPAQSRRYRKVLAPPVVAAAV